MFLRLLAYTARFLLAFTFLLSGFVKAVDPMGMAYKLEAYMQAWHIGFTADMLALQLGGLMLATVEFGLGIHLLLGMRSRFTSRATLAFMLVFTLFTVYVFVANPINDCGCFGEAVVLTNGETLCKNIVLLIAAVIVCFRVEVLRNLRFVSERSGWLTSLYATIFIIVLGLNSLAYLPPIDFTPYRVGTDMREAMRGEYATTFTYTKDDITKTFDESHLPDTTWTYVDSETQTITAPQIADFALTDTAGCDVTDAILGASGNVFLMTLPHEPSADAGSVDRINDIYDYCIDHGAQIYTVTAATARQRSHWKDLTGANYQFLQASDDIVRAMVRSNPGLLLLRQGRIIAKWSHNDLPDETVLDDVCQMSAETQMDHINRSVRHLLLIFLCPLLLLIVADKAYDVIKRKKTIKIQHHETENCSR